MTNYYQKQISKNKGCKFLISIVIVFFLLSCSVGNKFSNHSETEQEELYDDLSERLDQYFIPTIQENLLAFLFVLNDDNESLEDVILEKISVEMFDVCEQWATDNNIDFKDWVNLYAEDFSMYYILHLLEFVEKLEN